MSNDRKKFISGRVVFVLCAALLNVQPSSLQSGDGIREDDEEWYGIAKSCPTCRLEVDKFVSSILYIIIWFSWRMIIIFHILILYYVFILLNEDVIL